MRYDRKTHAAFSTSNYVFSQLIPYIGNKRKLLPLIQEAITSTGLSTGRFVDFFAGSGVVSRFAKQLGFSVLANDWEPYALQLNRCWIECDHAPKFAAFGGYDRAIKTLNALPPCTDWVTTHLCPANDDQFDMDRDRLFYTRANGQRIDAIRNQISAWERESQIDTLETSALIAPLLYAACYGANTSGVFKGFHRGWGGQTQTALYRILGTLALRPATFIASAMSRSSTSQLDATTLARSLRATGPIDIAYLDPPYNQHPYASNYHVLNSIALWDKPAVSPKITGRGDKSAIRTDWRTTRRSLYNDHRHAEQAYRTLLDAIDARFILTSYSTDGTIELDALLDACMHRGATRVLAQPYKRYRVSSQRFSPKPMNVEFIAIVDTSKPHVGTSCAELADSLRAWEANALQRHEAGVSAL